jgi:hypothetical protein
MPTIRRAEASDAPILSVLLAQLGYPASVPEIPERLSAIANHPASRLGRVRRDEPVWRSRRIDYGSHHSVHSRQRPCGLAHDAGCSGRRTRSGHRVGARPPRGSMGGRKGCKAIVGYIGRSATLDSRVLREARLPANWNPVLEKTFWRLAIATHKIEYPTRRRIHALPGSSCFAFHRCHIARNCAIRDH